MIQPTGPAHGRHRSPVRRPGFTVAAMWVWVTACTAAASVIVVAAAVAGHDPVRWIQP